MPRCCRARHIRYLHPWISWAFNVCPETNISWRIAQCASAWYVIYICMTIDENWDYIFSLPTKRVLNWRRRKKKTHSTNAANYLTVSKSKSVENKTFTKKKFWTVIPVRGCTAISGHTNVMWTRNVICVFKHNIMGARFCYVQTKE